MRSIIILLTFSATVGHANAQSITVSLAQVYTHTNAVVPVVNGGDDFENTSRTFAISYEHYFRNSMYSLLASFIKYDGCTFIYFEPGGWVAGGGDALARGFCSGIDLHRFDGSS